MKNHILIPLLILFSIGFVNAQQVFLSKVEKINENKDKQLLMVNPEEAVEYLGEIDVIGFSNDDTAVFSEIYKKAKEVGANSFAYKPFETVDGKPNAFNPANYKISLYYTSKENITNQKNIFYIFSSSSKPQKISVNRKDYIIDPRSYIEILATPGEVYTISTKKLLGSTIKVGNKTDFSAQYFQISALKVQSNKIGEPGINLKSGDIMALDSSYGDFLRMIYTKNNK